MYARREWGVFSSFFLRRSEEVVVEKSSQFLLQRAKKGRVGKGGKEGLDCGKVSGRQEDARGATTADKY